MDTLLFISEILWLNLTALVRISLVCPNSAPTHPHLFLQMTSLGLTPVGVPLDNRTCLSSGCCCWYFFAASNANSARVSISSGSSSGFSCLNLSYKSDRSSSSDLSPLSLSISYAERSSSSSSVASPSSSESSDGSSVFSISSCSSQSLSLHSS